MKQFASYHKAKCSHFPHTIDQIIVGNDDTDILLTTDRLVLPREKI